MVLNQGIDLEYALFQDNNVVILNLLLTQTLMFNNYVRMEICTHYVF